MTKIREIGEAARQAWVATRPPCVQKLCRQMPAAVLSWRTRSLRARRAGASVYFHWSASEVLSAQFVRWQLRRFPRKHDGTRQPGWWGVGAVVYSDLFRAGPRNALPAGYRWLAPHIELYRTYRGAVTRRGETRVRPTVEAYLKQRRRSQGGAPHLRERLHHQAAMLRDWQAHARRMGRILGCMAITDDIEHAARVLVRLRREVIQRAWQWSRAAKKYAQ